MFALILEGAPMGVYAIDTRGRSVYANREAVRLLGKGITPRISKRALAELPVEYQAYVEGTDELYPEYRLPIARALKGEATAIDDMELRRRDGSVTPLEVIGTPVYDARGRVTYAMIVFRDISDIKKARREYQQSQEQLRRWQRIDAVGRLAGGVAHDFNNQLTAILGFAELALDRVERESPLRGPLEKIFRAGEKAATLTRHLLAFGRRQVLNPKVVNVNEVVAESIQILDRLIGEGVEVAFVRGTGHLCVKVDSAQMEQIILNLAVNARDAMPNGGRLTFETSVAALDESYAREHPEVSAGAYVLLSVSDTGTGMERETRERAFEPFYTTKEAGQGTGLGLSMVHGTVKQSGGYIWLYSEPGHGTTFKIYLPQVQEEPDSPASRRERPSRGRGETILVAEDEEGVRGLIESVLAGNGYRVLVAGGGREALEVWESRDRPIDLLLTDVVMPGMDGRTLAEKLLAERADLPVIYMSGYAESVMLNPEQRPASRYLQKPIVPTALLGVVREVLEAGRGSSGPPDS